jgi:lipopolysaccharide heptosyltransferase II
MNIKLMKLLDAAVGNIAVSCIPSPPDCMPSTPLNSLLLIRPGGIGDAALLAPTIHAIKKIYPQARITVLAERRNAGVFALIAAVDQTFSYDIPREFIRALRARYDVVIDTEQWHQLSAVVARLVMAPVKIGFDTNQRRRMFTDVVPYSHDVSEVRSFTRLQEPLGMEVPSTVVNVPFLTVPKAAAAKAAELLGNLHDDPSVAIFPGASIAERRWGADRFRRMAEMLSVFGIKTVVVGGKDDQQQGDEIVGGVLGLNLAGLTSLTETAAVIQKSALLLSGDSGVLHLAVGLGIPTVSLFGPGRAKKWAPQGERHVVITKELPCSPCTTFGTTPPCPINAKCMQDITVAEVINAVTMLLTSEGAMRSHCCKRDS